MIKLTCSVNPSRVNAYFLQFYWGVQNGRESLGFNHEQRKKLKQMGKRDKPTSKKLKQEKVNWKEIIGMNRDTYTGRMRQLEGCKFND
ncbi:hypothetical protein BIV60_27825 [Bacillus sp. MUM 116]|nr:hypothetical protein BIV60_27825 [Bacillus sp. MUM 116]